MDKKSTLNREPEPYYKKSHKGWYVQLDGKQYRLCDAAEKAEKVPLDGQLAWHRVMARLDEEPQEDTVEAEVERGPTVISFVNDFLAAVKLQVSRKKLATRTLEWYKEHLDRFVEFIDDDLALSEFKKSHVKKWLEQDYSEAGDNYVNGAVRAVCRVFNWAVEEELITTSPLAGYKRASYQPRECKLTDDQWALVLSVLKKDDPFTDIVWFLYLTGCRPFEARTATDFHFDRESRALIFERVNSKGKKSQRLVVLNDKAMEIVERRRGGSHIFTNRLGNPWTSYSLNCRFARIREELAKKGETFDVFPYIFRHTFATRALKLGLTSANVAALLGHKGTAMVDNVYGHLKDLEHLHKELRRTSA